MELCHLLDSVFCLRAEDGFVSFYKGKDSILNLYIVIGNGKWQTWGGADNVSSSFFIYLFIFCYYFFFLLLARRGKNYFSEVKNIS